LLRDLAETGCAHVTIGQYLQPTRDNLPVQRYYSEDEFEEFAARAREIGFTSVDAGPLVRSSYHAGMG
jgi:lipoic acid synthetase